MTLNFRAAFRRLRRSHAFAVSVVLILALGIGANDAVFAIVNAVLLRSLPYGDPSRLVSLSESNLRTGQTKTGVLPGSVLDWEQRSHSFDAISMFWMTRVLVSVTQRLPEFAIRLALGATPEGLRGSVLREASYVVGIGLIAGAVGAWAGTRLLQTQLLGVGGFDAETWIITVIVLAASALTAAWAPARRAARSDPGSMLRMSSSG